MKTFFICRNNGVTAVVREEILAEMTKRELIFQILWKRHHRQNWGFTEIRETIVRALRHLPEVPIFTFTSEERAGQSPWFTGGEELLGVLKRRFCLIDCHRSFFVPFSNGSELGYHGVEEMARELAYVTTEEQFRDTFGVSIAELRAEISVTA